MHVITYQFRSMSEPKTISIPANKPRTLYSIVKRLREKQVHFTHTFID